MAGMLPTPAKAVKPRKPRQRGIRNSGGPKLNAIIGTAAGKQGLFQLNITNLVRRNSPSALGQASSLSGTVGDGTISVTPNSQAARPTVASSLCLRLLPTAIANLKSKIAQSHRLPQPNRLWRPSWPPIGQYTRKERPMTFSRGNGPQPRES